MCVCVSVCNVTMTTSSEFSVTQFSDRVSASCDMKKIILQAKTTKSRVIIEEVRRESLSFIQGCLRMRRLWKLHVPEQHNRRRWDSLPTLLTLTEKETFISGAFHFHPILLLLPLSRKSSWSFRCCYVNGRTQWKRMKTKVKETSFVDGACAMNGLRTSNESHVETLIYLSLENTTKLYL